MNIFLCKAIVYLRSADKEIRQCEDIDDEQFSTMVLEIDRIRATLSHLKNGKPCGNTLAKNCGHQPSCDGNCIATRGNEK
jgi:hypothetical protein